MGQVSRFGLMKRGTTIPRNGSTASKWSSDLLRKHGGMTGKVVVIGEFRKP